MSFVSLRPFLFAVVFIALSLPALASAEWDPSAFVELLGTADQAFVEGRWEDAHKAYQQLDSELTESLATDEIPTEQRADARMAHSTIQYQLALTLLREHLCTEARDRFQVLLDVENVEVVVRIKLDARLGEALVCVASQQYAEGKTDQAVASADAAWVRLETIDPHRMETLGDEAPEVVTDVSAGVKGLAAALARPTAPRACGLVKVFDKLTGLAVVDPSRSGTSEVAAVSASCAEPVPPIDEGQSLGPLIVMGGGAALVAAFLLNEAILMGTSSDFQDARDECEAGVVSSCPQSMDLADELDSGAVLSGLLLGVGAAALGGGAAWWWFDQPTTSDQPAISARVSPEGAMVSLRFTWGR